MQGVGIVHGRVDSRLLQGGGQAVPIRGPHHVQVVHVVGVRRLGGQGQGLNVPQSFVIARGHPAPALVPPVQVRQLDTQNRSLEPVHPVVIAQLSIPELLAGILAMIAQLAQFLGQSIVISDDAASVAVRPKVLARIETEAPGVAQGSGRPFLVARPLSLGRILHHRQTALCCQLQQRVHVCGLAVDVDRYDGPGPVRDPVLHPIDIQGETLRFDIRQHWPGAQLANRLGRSPEGVGSGDHLVPLPYIQGPQHQLQGIRAVAHPDAVIDVVVVGESLFKGLHLRAQNKGAVFHDFSQGGIYLWFYLLVLEGQIIHRDPPRPRG